MLIRPKQPHCNYIIKTSWLFFHTPFIIDIYLDIPAILDMQVQQYSDYVTFHLKLLGF